MQSPRATLLIASYRHPQFLFRTLLGLTRQTVRDFEIIVCEDGSDPHVADTIARFESRYALRVSHLTQEDRGFRKCRILNAGIRHSRADYLVFLDGDCIPHRRFLEGHLRAREAARFLAGRRVELGAKFTARLADEDILSGRLDRLLAFGLTATLRGEIRHLEAAIYIPWRLGRLLQLKRVRMLGCNFSCWKADMFAINGFNEDFETPGYGEDGDIRRRFERYGLTGLSVKNLAICFHHYHPRVPRSPAPEWHQRLRQGQQIRCERGLVQAVS
jgi:glycosyltransferase involved in cell wall biosynthesis